MFAHQGSATANRRQNCGFTLIELMLTITVAAVLLGIAAPSFSNMIASWRLTSQTNEMVAAIHLARAEAIKLNRPVMLCRTDDINDTACAATSADWAHWIVATTDLVARQGSPENTGSIRITSTFTNDTLQFGPSGLPFASADFLVCSTFDLAENQRLIEVGPGNRVSVTRQAGACG
ncbi:MAG TPA: GspH/FimT family pseudopilin [Azoarcus sp.]|nr:GspH/FimT family pseudopilin [Azoarcus sp.]